MGKRRKSRKSTLPPIRQRIFGEGLTSGVFYGIAFITGIVADPDGLRLQVLEILCDVTSVGVSCNKTISLLAFLGTMVTIFSILFEVMKLRVTKYFGNIPPFVEGLIFYGLGLLVGFLFIVIFI